MNQRCKRPCTNLLLLLTAFLVSGCDRSSPHIADAHTQSNDANPAVSETARVPDVKASTVVSSGSILETLKNSPLYDEHFLKHIEITVNGGHVTLQCNTGSMATSSLKERYPVVTYLKQSVAQGDYATRLESSVEFIKQLEGVKTVSTRDNFLYDGKTVGNGINDRSSFAYPTSLTGNQHESRNDLSNACRNMELLGLALVEYHETHSHFPAAAASIAENGVTRPLLSWRVHVLPFVDESDLYEQFHLNEPWDSEHNIELVQRIPAIYRSQGASSDITKTRLVTIRTLASAFPGTDAIRRRDIYDGTSNTIAIVETTDANAVTWSQPEDITPDFDKPIENTLRLHGELFLAILCDGSLQGFPKDLETQIFRAASTRRGKEREAVPLSDFAL